MPGFDPAQITHEQRKLLQRILRDLAVTTEQPFPDLVEAANDGPIGRGPSYFDDMSKGTYSRALARKIHGWLTKHHRETAHASAPDLFSDPADIAVEEWEAHLKAHAIRGRLMIITDLRQRGLGELRSKITPPDATLKLGEDFCFAFNSETETIGLMIQIYQQQWHAMPIGRSDDDATFPLLKGWQRFPRTSDGALDPIVERTHPGEHRFLLIVGQKESLAKVVERGLPASMVGSDHHVGLHLITAEIG